MEIATISTGGVKVPFDNWIKELAKSFVAIFISGNKPWAFHHVMAPVIHANFDASCKTDTKRRPSHAQPFVHVRLLL
jgi:hypothetical protein